MKTLLPMLTMVLLSACHAEEPADLKTYLMQHPLILNREMVVCDRQPASSVRCDVVMKAAYEMRDLINEQQRDPQAFGKRILRAEMDLAQTGQGAEELKVLLAVVGLTGPE